MQILFQEEILAPKIHLPNLVHVIKHGLSPSATTVKRKIFPPFPTVFSGADDVQN